MELQAEKFGLKSNKKDVSESLWRVQDLEQTQLGGVREGCYGEVRPQRDGDLV